MTCARNEETKKDEERNLVLWYSGKLGIRPDHTRHPIKIPFGVVGGLPALVISFKFHRHRLSGYRAVRGRILANFG